MAVILQFPTAVAVQEKVWQPRTSIVLQAALAIQWMLRIVVLICQALLPRIWRQAKAPAATQGVWRVQNGGAVKRVRSYRALRRA